MNNAVHKWEREEAFSVRIFRTLKALRVLRCSIFNYDKGLMLQPLFVLPNELTS